jgi:predicted nucleic acid-binding protein
VPSAVPLVAGSSLNKTRYKVVVDTSVIISAFYFGGSSQEVFMHVARQQHLILSDFIIGEFIAFAKSTQPKTEHQIIRLMRKQLEKYVYDYSEADDVKVRDINDIPVVQLAAEYEAVIVTGDKDMLEYKGDSRVIILSVDEYRELFL